MDENSKTDELLEEQLNRHLEELGKNNVGCEEAKALIDDFVELNNMAVERKKLEIEKKKVENEAEKIKADREMQKRNARIEHGIQIAGHILQVIGLGVTFKIAVMNNQTTRETAKEGIEATTKWLRGILRFEKTGSVASLGGKSVAANALRLKK